MFGFEGFFDHESTVVMFKKSCFDVLEVSRPCRGCLEMKGFFDLGSMILMSKNDVIDVLGVLGRVWGCSEMKDFEVLCRWDLSRK